MQWDISVVIPQDKPYLEGRQRDDLRRTVILYLVAGMLCLLAEILLFNLWKADLRIPFYYPIGTDLLHHLMVTKNITETGSFLSFPRIGAPGTFDHHDFTSLDYLHCFTLKLMASMFRDPGTTYNLFYLLSFFLITWTSLFTMRRLGISRPVAVVASLLYAFMPYHLLRGEYHPFLSAYYAIPLIVLLLLRICEGKPLFFGWGPHKVRWRVVAFTAITCAVVAGSGVYTAFFSLYFLAVASLIGFSRNWRSARLVDGLLAMALIASFVMIEAMPTFLYVRAHGKNPTALRREASESEVYALSFSRMLQPVPYHRFNSLAKVALGRGQTAWRGKLDEFVMGTERDFVALGMFGTFGLLALLVSPFLVRKPAGTPTLLDPLWKMCLAGVLLGVPGGIGYLVALYVSPNFRSLNRVSIFIAYFCVLATALLIDELRRRAASPRRRPLFNVAIGVILVICLLDQTPGFLVPDYDLAKEVFARDREFFRRVEATLPSGSMVFLLPFAEFPDGFSATRKIDRSKPRGEEKLQPYMFSAHEHARPFLHTDRLRFSSPMMRGRGSYRWHARLRYEPIDRVVEELTRTGFRGINIDRGGYDDRADTLIADLRRILGSDPLESPDHRFAFFPLNPANPPVATAGSKE